MRGKISLSHLALIIVPAFLWISFCVYDLIYIQPIKEQTLRVNKVERIKTVFVHGDAARKDYYLLVADMQGEMQRQRYSSGTGCGDYESSISFIYDVPRDQDNWMKIEWEGPNYNKSNCRFIIHTHGADDVQSAPRLPHWYGGKPLMHD